MIRLREWLDTPQVRGRIFVGPIFEITEETQKMNDLGTALYTGFYSVIRRERGLIVSIRHIESGQAFEVHGGLRIEPTEHNASEYFFQS